MEIKFSGILITYNDDKYLDKFLESIKFCDEIIVVDLGSTDKTLDIAKKFKCKVYHHDWTPLADEIRQESINKYTSFDWIVFRDPDEVLPDGIKDHFISEITKNNKIGRIYVPMKYYFRETLLKYTRWGGIKKVLGAFHRDALEMTGDVHRFNREKGNYDQVYIDVCSGSFFVKHFWCDSYSQFIEKHARYLKLEGESRYNAGLRYSLKKMLQDTWNEFYLCFWKKRGVKGGLTGIILSFLWGWYIFNAWRSLYRFEKNLKNSE